MTGGVPAALPYREVLLPRPWVWLMPIGFAAFLGVAYGYAYGSAAGWLVGLATASALLAWLALGTRTSVAVDAGTVRADRAQLPARYIGRVRPLDPQATFRARTAAADPRAFLMLRPWASASSVVMEVTDPADPHPYWLISTRRPQRLADALVAARAGASAG